MMSNVLTLLALLPSGLAAQALADGVWPGELTTPDGTQVPVALVVQHRKDKPVLTLRSRGEPDVVMGGVKLRDGWELTFTWAASRNAFYFCRLTRRDLNGPFDGRCEDNRASVGGGPVRASLIVFPPLSQAEPPPR